MFKVNWNIAGFSFCEIFDCRVDAESFAKDRQAYGCQTLIMEIK